MTGGKKMKSRMLVSLLVIALAAAVIGGATMAWFTDSDVSDEVTFSAGTLLVDIEDFKVATENIKLDTLNPGDSWEYEFDVVNAGTKNLIFKGILFYKETLGKEKPELGLPEGYGTNPLSELLEVEFWVDGQDAPFYQGSLAECPMEFGEASLTPADGDQQSLGYRVKVTLPTTADNKYQGSGLDATFVILARQIHADAEYPAFDCPYHGVHGGV
jgi:predicted ribosomally synthesized peptide with SipW-like signal peptide